MTQQDRRRFLEDALWSAAAVSGAPTLLLPRADPTTPPAQRLAAALIGLRGRGNTHLGVLASRGDVEIRWLCDVDCDVAHRRAAETQRRERPRPRVTDDLRRVLDDPRVDVVVIAAPLHWQALAALWAMQAGKHVYLEAPICLTLQEAERLETTASRLGVVCQTGLQGRCHAALCEAVAFLHRGELGDVSEARAICRQPRGRRCWTPRPQGTGSINKSLWFGPASPENGLSEPVHFDWRWFWRFGMGLAGAPAVHYLDLARWGLGQQRWPDASAAFGGRLPSTHGQTPDLLLAAHRFGAQTCIHEVTSWPALVDGVRREGVLFTASGGYLALHGLQGGAAFDHRGRCLRRFHGPSPATKNALDNFLEAVRFRKADALSASLQDGALTTILGILGNISFRLAPVQTLQQATRALDRWTLSAEEAVGGRFAEIVACLAKSDAALQTGALLVGPQLELDAAGCCIVQPLEAHELAVTAYRQPFVLPESPC